MNLRDRLVKKLDSFFEVVTKSINAESELIQICIREMKKGQTEALKILLEMQKINGDRIALLENMFKESTKEINKNLLPRITKASKNIKPKSKELIKKYEGVAKIETSKQIAGIGDMFDKLEDNNG